MANGRRGHSKARFEETRVAPVEDEVTAPRFERPAQAHLPPLGDDEPAEFRTMFASHAALFAERLRDRFSRKMYGRPHRVLRIDEPEGPSTAGGRLARQPLLLVPRKGSGPNLVCGWVDVPKKEAQLRGHESVSRRFEAQHGTPLELAPEEYERFLDDLVETMCEGGIKVRVLVPEGPSAQAPSPAQASRTRGVSPWRVGSLAVLTFLLGLLVGRMLG
jgi:hypothetical protein